MNIYYDINKEKAKDVWQWFKEGAIISVSDPADAELIVVAGGDGTLIRSVQKYMKYRRPFFGINRGTVGFLLNPVKDFNDYLASLRDLIFIRLRLLKVEFLLKDGKKISHFVFNDAFIRAQHGEICEGTVRGERYPEKKFRGDGIIITTVQGSTAYSRSAGGKILPLVDKLMGITTICSMTKPIRDPIIGQQVEVEITRGNVVAHADFFPVDGVKLMKVEPTNRFVSLAFRKDYNFDIVRYIEEY